MNTRPLIGQQFGAAAGQWLRERLPGVDVVDTEPGPAGWRPDLDALLMGPTKYWRDQPRPAGWPGRLRIAQLPSTGVDGYPAWLFEVPCVTSAPGLNAHAIAEFVLASMLAHEKRMPEAWIHGADQWKTLPLGTLAGKTLALAGIGAIGSAVARHALGFGMKVVALRRSAARPMEGVEVVTEASALAPLGDHLVLCLPLTPETRHMVGQDFLAACKPGLHLVNVARGGLVDQPALLQALDAGVVGAASLDVTEPEPLPAGHPLYTHPRVRLSPHIAWSTPDTVPRLAALIADQWTLLASGREPRHRVAAPAPAAR